MMMGMGPDSFAGVECKECGLFHPPVKHGEVCPIAGTKTGADSKEEIEGITNFFSTLKIMIKSNMEYVDDSKKLFTNLIMLNQKYFDMLKNKK